MNVEKNEEPGRASFVELPDAPEAPVSFTTRVKGWATAPWLPAAIFGIAVIGATGYVLSTTPGGAFGVGGPGNIVTFDPVKLGNAQRAVASRLLSGGEDSSEAGMLLAKVGKAAEAIILEEAAGATVLVKQAVVLSAYPEITDKVLVRLGLPTDVPTTHSAMFSSDIAPTAGLSSILRSTDAALARQAEVVKDVKRMRGDSHEAALP